MSDEVKPALRGAIRQSLQTANLEDDERGALEWLMEAFTREDVELLREAAGSHGDDGSGYWPDAAEEAQRLRDLADRIEALLPPEES